MTISIQYEDEEGWHLNHNIVTTGHIKFARFTVGTVTIEINTDNQDVNSANPPTVQNIRQNTATSNMVSGGGSSQPGAHKPSLQLAGQNNSTSPSQINKPIKKTETPQITGSVHRTETQETTLAIHEIGNPQGTRSTRPGNEEVKNQNNVKEDNFVNTMRGWLMTVATLLMNMAFQSGMSIPGGYWADTKINSSSASIDSSNDTKHTAGQPIIMNMDHYRYFSFLILNVAAFGTAMLVIILLLFNKLPQHTLLSIRWLLVYAMVIITMVYVIGCAPKIVLALYISAFMLNCMIIVFISWVSWLLFEYFRSQLPTFGNIWVRK